MAPALCARGLLLLGLILAGRGEDDCLALVQHGVRVRQLPAANLDLPDWVKNLISSGVEEEAEEDLGDDLSDAQQQALDEEAENGEDFYLNYTALEEQDAMESIANETAPMLKWLFLETAHYDSTREFTNSKIWGDWRYDGNPGKFTINSNPQGELVYHTEFEPDHEAIGILLPISEGRWLLQATVRDPNQNPLSLVRVKAMDNASNLVVSFADANATKWSREVLAARSTPLDKLLSIQKLELPAPKREKPEQEQDHLRDRLDFNSIDKGCLGPLMLLPSCIKKHGLPKRGGILGNQGVGEVRKSKKSKADYVKMVRKLMDAGGLDSTIIDKAQAVAEAFFASSPEQESLVTTLWKSLQGADPERQKELIKVVVGEVTNSLGMDFNVTEAVEMLFGAVGGDLMGAVQGLSGGAGVGDLMKVVQGFMGGQSGGAGLPDIMGVLQGLSGGKSGATGGANMMGVLQGLLGGGKSGGTAAADLMRVVQGALGGKSGGGANLAGVMPLVQGLLGGGKSGGGANLAGLMPLVQGFLGGKSGAGASLAGLMPLMQGLLAGGGKEGGGMDLAAIMQGVLGGGKGGAAGNLTGILESLLGGKAGAGVGGNGDLAASLQGLLGGLNLPAGNASNKSLVQHVAGLFDSDDPEAQPGERPMQALHRKFKAMRHDLGIGDSARHGANATSGSPSQGLIRSIRESFTGQVAQKAASEISGSSRSKPGIIKAFTGTEEQKQRMLYGACQKQPAKQIANYSTANRTAMGMQMWWPYDLNENALDYGWLVDDWTDQAGLNVGSPFPEDGIITGWEWYGSATHVSLGGARTMNETVHFQVLRWAGGMTGTQFQLVAQSTANSTTLRAKNNLALDPKDYLTVKKGDFVGFYSPKRTSFGYSMAPMCDIQVKFTPPSSSTSHVGSTADYMLGGEKNSPRVYHFHAQYIPNPTSSPTTQLARA